MVSREVSESSANLEKDVILNNESAAPLEAAAEKVSVEEVSETPEQVENPQPAEPEAPVADAVEEVAKAAPEAVAEAVEEVAEAAPEAVAEAVEEVAEAAPEAVAEAVEEVVEAAPEAVAEAVEEVAEAAPEAVAEAVEEVAEAAPEAVEEVAEEVEKPAPNYAEMDKGQLVAALEALVNVPAEQIKDEAAQIKAAFYALQKEEVEKAKAAFVAEGNDEAAFVPAEDAAEARVKELLGEIKEKRAELHAAQEAVKAENLAKKRAIIEEIQNIINDPDNVNRQYNRVQALQQEFRGVGEVPAPNVTELWKTYQVTVEKFYDLLKMNKELRDYDFRKNLEIKQQLCAEAEALDQMDGTVDAFKRLQELHATWRETGPVAKELREELWNRFKAASSIINKKYQSFFEERKAAEKENADAKTALCEQLEAISTEGLKSYAAWDEVTKQIIGIQEEWKKLGFASRKVNATLFARYRKACDDFFGKKAEFFKQMKEELSANLAKKIDLCERAEALKESTEWRKTTDAMVALQKEWKTVGPVAKKHSDAVWKRFISACDYFFEQKKKQTSNVHSIEHENLKAKKEVIAKINEALEADDPQEGAQQVRDLMAKWQEIGHVPFKEKDKVYDEYRKAVDKAYEKFDMKAVRARLANFEKSIDNLSDSDKVYHERERLVRSFEVKNNELKTYENNLGFLNATSKTGNTLVKEIERKVEKLKEEIALLEKKIKMIDDKM